MPPTSGYLSIDADEALSEALEGEIWQIKKNGPAYDAYTVPRLAQYMGRWILHSGWYPDRKIRLYNRGKARWVGDFVHESVQVQDALVISNRICFTLRAIRSPSISRQWTVTPRSRRSKSCPRESESASSHLLLDPTMDIRKDILSETRLSGWFRGTYDSVHGCALQFR